MKYTCGDLLVHSLYTMFVSETGNCINLPIFLATYRVLMLVIHLTDSDIITLSIMHYD
jgi:hypothetical protein